jgi:hypothetical protein
MVVGQGARVLMVVKIPDLVACNATSRLAAFCPGLSIRLES